MPDPTPPTGGTSGAGSTENFDTWYANARAIIMNLNTSDDFLTKYISNQFSQVGDGSADSLAKKNALRFRVRPSIISQSIRLYLVSKKEKQMSN